MSESVPILLPKLGESIVSATIVKWFKKEGDLISRDEPLLEVSTDKVNSEIPSPIEGVLEKILAWENDEIDVGAPLAYVKSAHGLSSPMVSAPARSSPEEEASKESADLLSPSVLRLLQEKKIPLSDIEKIPHTGEGGRLTKRDVENYCPLAKKSSDTLAVERVQMNPLRKAIADNMVRSFYEAPHATLLTEVDVTEIVRWIAREKESFFAKHQAKISITAFVAQAIGKALELYPHINSSLEKDTIVVKKHLNLGIAVSVDQGVMVPVIRKAETLLLPELAREIGNLAKKAREHTLAPEEVQQGSLTMTNFGMTGIEIGIPIIRFPEVAIVGLGGVKKKVVPMSDDSIAIRSQMWISLTFDHRVLDGLYGCGFLSSLKENLEKSPL